MPVSIERAIAAFRPDVVVNPAAYTAVDKAESWNPTSHLRSIAMAQASWRRRPCIKAFR